MQIEHYKVLQTVLSQVRDVICDVYSLSKEEAFERAELFIKQNSEQWKLADPDIDYNDPFCRIAYLYMNVAIHANLVELAISSSSQIGRMIRDKIKSGEELRICALGGGPGSELLGVVRFIQGLKIPDKTAHLDFVLVDGVKEWDESWHAMKRGVEEQLKTQHGIDRSKWPVSISRSFLPLDVTSITDFENFATRFSGTDLFLICYLVSELKTFASKFGEVLNFLIRRANSGSLLLFIDRDEKEVRESVEEIIEHNQSLSKLNLTKERGRLKDNPADLGEWFIHIPSIPRQNWLAFFAVAQKKVKKKSSIT